MLRLILICLLCTITVAPAFAQRKTGQARLDSLLAELPRAKPDTNRVKLLNGIGREFLFSNLNEANNYSRQALELAKRLTWKKGQSRSYVDFGNIYLVKADYAQALLYYLSGLKIAEAIKDKDLIATITGAIGLVYASLADYPQALTYYEKALKGAENLGNKSAAGVWLNNIGATYYAQGEYRKALDYYQKQLKSNEFLKGGGSGSEELNFDNVGLVYLSLSDYPQALSYLQKGLNLSKASNNKFILVRSYSNLGDLYFRMASDSNTTLLTTLLGSTKTRTLQKASAYADSAVWLANERGDLLYLSRAYQTRSQIQNALGEPQAALASYQDFIKTKDLVINQQNSNKIAVATLQYEFDKKETALHFEQQLTAAQLQKQTLLTKQQAQELSLKAQAAQLANKERDLQKLQYLQEKEAKQTKEKQLAFSQKEQALKATALGLSQAEVQHTTRQRTYLLGGVGLLATLLGFIIYGYSQKQKANLILHQQKEEINQKSNQLEQSLAELRATQTQLIQKEKMAFLGELTAGIAHEIQNPLNFVNNFSEVSTELMEELKEEAQAGNTDDVLAIADDLTQNLQKITHHGKRASAIVKGMLEHSRSSTGEKRPTNLNDLANEYLKIAYQGLRAKDKNFNAALITDFEANLGLIEVVPQEIGRVLLNLYNNAFYAVQQKQKIAPPSYKSTITVRTIQVNGHYQIRVIDNGTGMPESVKTKIFQPFFTTKPTGKGTGLGLSLSYDIITKGHGGSLTVESQEGKGTTFLIQLPTLNVK